MAAGDVKHGHLLNDAGHHGEGADRRAHLGPEVRGSLSAVAFRRVRCWTGIGKTAKRGLW